MLGDWVIRVISEGGKGGGDHHLLDPNTGPVPQRDSKAFGVCEYAVLFAWPECLNAGAQRPGVSTASPGPL